MVFYQENIKFSYLVNSVFFAGQSEHYALICLLFYIFSNVQAYSTRIDHGESWDLY